MLKISDQLSLQGKIALITGASSGLGAHFAMVLAAMGAKVMVGARRSERASQVAQNIRESGGKGAAVAMDVTDSTSVRHAFDLAEETFGTVSILVNNAGIARPSRFVDISEKDWDAVMDTNLRSILCVSQIFVQRISANDSAGSIVNIASILGMGVGFGKASYGTSKAGVIQLTKAMALELGRKNIRVNAISPGYFSTAMNAQFLESEQGKRYISATPAGRCGEFDELNVPLLLLASDAGSFINGAIIPVDGGHLLRSL